MGSDTGWIVGGGGGSQRETLAAITKKFEKFSIHIVLEKGGGGGSQNDTRPSRGGEGCLRP